MRRPALLLFVIALGACDAREPTPVAPPATSSPAVSEAPSAALGPSAPPPAELDIAAQQRALKCATDAKSGACGVLTKMAHCGAWSPIVPSGDGRWIGRGWLIEGAKTTEQFTLVRARRVPTSEVASGQLGVRIAVAELGKQEGAAWEQADRAIRAYERADVPPRGTPTLDFVKQKSDWTESFAAKTAGTQIVALDTRGTYFCQGTPRSIVLVQRASGTGADGLYAELWPTSW